jgi:hypothetical protein
VRISFCHLSHKNGGMAARYHSGYLVSRRRGALSHAEALATRERLHLDSVHIPNSFVSVRLAELFDRGLREFDATTQVVDIQDLLHCCH